MAGRSSRADAGEPFARAPIPCQITSRQAEGPYHRDVQSRYRDIGEGHRGLPCSSASAYCRLPLPVKWAADGSAHVEIRDMAPSEVVALSLGPEASEGSVQP